MRSQTEVANFDLRVEAVAGDEHVEELEVEVDEALFVHVADALSDLLDNVAGAMLGHPFVLVWLSEAVLKEVATLGVLADEVSCVSNFEVVDEADDVVALLAEVHGLSFRSVVLAGEALVLLGRDSFDSNLDASNFRLTDDNCVALTLVNFSLKCVLVELGLEALGAQSLADKCRS